MDTAKIEAIARVAHEANRGWCEAHGDTSQKVWELAEEWQRSSAINGVRFVLEHPDAGDSAQHENWMREKVEQGWVYGPEKNADLRTHPCLMPFEKLPPMQQAKDRLFRAIVLALAGRGSA